MARLFAALTDPAELVQWLGPRGIATPEAIANRPDGIAPAAARGPFDRSRASAPAVWPRRGSEWPEDGPGRAATLAVDVGVGVVVVRVHDVEAMVVDVDHPDRLVVEVGVDHGDGFGHRVRGVGTLGGSAAARAGTSGAAPATTDWRRPWPPG